MAGGEFSRTIWVPASVDEAWEVLTDVDRLVGWVTILESVTELEYLKSYQAVIKDRIGIFTLSASADIDVKELIPRQMIRFEAVGEDHQVGARIKVDAALSLAEALKGTDTSVKGRYEVTGRVATLGANTIKAKAEKILDEFYSEVHRSLG